MTRIARVISVSLLLLVPCFGGAASATAAPFAVFGDCMRTCNLSHAECLDSVFVACRATDPPGSGEFAACLEPFLSWCNLLDFDCRYNFCVNEQPYPLDVVPQETVGQGTATTAD